MGFERVLHLGGARLEDIEQVTVAAIEILEHLFQLLIGRLNVEPKNPFNDVVGANLVGWIEVSWLSRGLEGPDDDPCRIGAQVQALPVQKLGWGQRGSLGAIEKHSHCRSTFVDSGLLGPTASASSNCRIATSPRRYDSTDSAPLF